MKAIQLIIVQLLLVSCIGNIEKGPLRYNPNGTSPFNQLALQQLTDNLAPKCQNCHSDWIRDEQEILKRIVPGNVAASPLYQVLVNGSMPKGGPAFTTAELDIVRTQILALTSTTTPPPPVTIETDFSRLKDGLLNDKCLVCHSWMKEEAGLQTRVVTGEPEKSKIYKLVINGRMPKNYEPITSAELALVHDYILDLGSPEPKVTFDQIQSEVLGPKCIKCHRGMKEESGIQWGIVAGKPDESKIYKAMANGSMPKQIKPVTDNELQLLHNYIKNLRPSKNR